MMKAAMRALAALALLALAACSSPTAPERDEGCVLVRRVPTPFGALTVRAFYAVCPDTTGWEGATVRQVAERPLRNLAPLTHRGTVWTR